MKKFQPHEIDWKELHFSQSTITLVNKKIEMLILTLDGRIENEQKFPKTLQLENYLRLKSVEKMKKLQDH